MSEDVGSQPLPATAARGSLALAWDSDLLYSFRHSPVTVVAAVLTLLCVGGALFAPWIAPHNPFDLASVNLLDAFTPPGWTAQGKAGYLLGTDNQGRDVLSAILYGTRRGGTYVASATNANGPNIQIITSTDLRTWVLHHDALPTLPAWAVRGDVRVRPAPP